LQAEHCSARVFHPHLESERIHADFQSIRRIMMSILIIIVQVVLGLLFVSIGSMTVAGRKMFVENFRRFGYPQWFRVVTGSLEILGGLGLLTGIWLPWLAALASAGLTLVMLGAVFTEIRTREPLQKVVLPLVMGALAIVVAVSYWPILLHLVVRQ
jgi:putative oxidoreductase